MQLDNNNCFVTLGRDVVCKFSTRVSGFRSFLTRYVTIPSQSFYLLLVATGRTLRYFLVWVKKLVNFSVLTGCDFRKWVLSSSALLLLFSYHSAKAQVIPDTSLINNSTVIKQGNTNLIGGGTRSGGNLFHSFQEFSVPTGEIANFNNVLDIQNIINRVTGRSSSNIDGLIKANGTANLFLINPNGIVFGQNARLDIGGSFLASTASSVIFGDRTEFNATIVQATPLLTVSVPVGLQYGKNPGNLQVLAANLRVGNGKGIALVGGNLSINGGQILAPGGRVEFGGLGGEGNLGLNVNGSDVSLSFPEGVPRDNVSIGNGAIVNVRAGGGGSIAINAQNIDISGSSRVRAGIATGLGTPESQGGDIELNATGTIKVSDRSFVANNVFGQGNSGFVKINAPDSISLDFGIIQSGVAEGGVGNSGGIVINTKFLNANNGSQIAAATDGNGNAGNVYINAAKFLNVNDGSQISTTTDGRGNAGSVYINADRVSFAGIAENIFSSGVLSGGGGVGDGGSINITADSLSITDGAALNSETGFGGQGRSGDINLNIKGTISIIGGDFAPTGESSRITLGLQPEGTGSAGGNLNIKTGSLILKDGGLIKASTQAQGNAGNIQIQADVVDISGSVPSSGLPSGFFTSTETNGKGGNIAVDTRTFRLTDGAVLSARSKGDGQGGNIQVNATESFEAIDGGQLVTTTFGQGEAGNIFVTAKDRVIISGSDKDYTNRIAKFPNPIDPLVANTITETGATSGFFANTQPNSTGKGGNIEIFTGKLQVEDAAQISVSSLGFGSAGNLKVRSQSTRLDNQAVIKADTTAGQGNINLTTGDLILRRNSNITTNARGSNIIGGNIILDTDILAAFENSDITANSAEFRGGNVNISTQSIIGSQFRDALTPESDITATGANSQLSGNVQIDTNYLDPTSGLWEFPDDFSDRSRLIAQSCPANQGNTFIITGRGGLPSLPNEMLRSDRGIGSGWVNLETRQGSDRSQTQTLIPQSSPPSPIVEATGWEIDGKGEITLTAAVPVNTSVICPPS
jgi:filamentous hemagglutinin family protein